LKISIITTCLNSEDVIEKTINSVLSQTYHNIEYIITDGGSVDATKKILNKFSNKFIKIDIQKDSGIYDGINRGINLSTGDFITTLHAGDFYCADNVLEKICTIINQNKDHKIFFGNTIIIKNSKIYRNYKSTNFKKEDLLIGIMPPHTSSFIAKEIYKKYGFYKKNYKIAGDYELFLRLLYINNLNFFMTDTDVTFMEYGGKSNMGFKSIFLNTTEMLQANKENNIKNNFIKLSFRLPIKLRQLWK